MSDATTPFTGWPGREQPGPVGDTGVAAPGSARPSDGGAPPEGGRAATAERDPRPVARRRPHPSHGARVMALVSSVAATVGVGAALALADGSPTSNAPGPAASTAVGAGSPAAASPASAPSARATHYANGVYVGPAEYTKWGDVQVQVTIQGGKIASTQEVEVPSDRKSAAINSRAQPILESEALAAQSAGIDSVSGATYTSHTYKASLQAALDQAATAATTAP